MILSNHKGFYFHTFYIGKKFQRLTLTAFLSFQVLRPDFSCDQSYKHFTLVIYYSRGILYFSSHYDSRVVNYELKVNVYKIDHWIDLNQRDWFKHEFVCEHSSIKLHWVREFWSSFTCSWCCITCFGGKQCDQIWRFIGLWATF